MFLGSECPVPAQVKGAMEPHGAAPSPTAPQKRLQGRVTGRLSWAPRQGPAWSSRAATSGHGPAVARLPVRLCPLPGAMNPEEPDLQLDRLPLQEESAGNDEERRLWLPGSLSANSLPSGSHRSSATAARDRSTAAAAHQH